MLNQLFGRRTDLQAVSAVYQRIVGQSRQPFLYTEFGVPDTAIGRFDMIVVHAFLVFRHLKAGGLQTEAFGQALFDHMFTDMDMSLREMGVGDLSVGKKVKALAKGFYGRVVAYEKALADADDRALRAALVRNVYPPVDPPEEAVAGLARYIRMQAEAVATRPVAEILSGRVEFAPVAETAQAAEPSQAGPAAAPRNGLAAAQGAGGPE